MSVPRVALIPVGRMDGTEVEGVLTRVSKVLRTPVDLREPAPLPRGTEDPARGQHNAPALLAALRQELSRLKVSRSVGGESIPAPAPPLPGAAIFVTDVDLFTPATDAAFCELDPARRVALLSVRRLREAFYRRKADPPVQRTRLVKEILRIAARLSTLPDCANPDCVLAPTRAVGDIDHKAEHYCGPCWKRLSSGTMRI